MQQNFTHQPFSNDTYNTYLTCMQKTVMPPNTYTLHNVANNSWNGFITFGLSNGTSDDPWGTNKHTWMEWNLQPMASNSSSSAIPGANRILITEPCDYVSNMAYYISMLTLCERTNWTMPASDVAALISAFNTLASGSAFYHGSGTNVGGTMDTTPIGQIALTSYQAAVYPLAASPIIADLRSTPRPPGNNGSQLVINQSLILTHGDVYHWNAMLNELYVPDYVLVFAASLVTVGRITLPDSVIKSLLSLFGKVFHFNANETDFLVNEFDPTIGKALEEQGVAPSTAQKIKILSKSFGTIFKLLYSFVWQEQFFVGKFLTSPNANRIGGLLIPYVNAITDHMTGYIHPDNVRKAKDIYPGDEVCRFLVAHAKWHEQSANGLVDLIFLTDDIHSVILGRNLSSDVELEAAMLIDGNGNGDSSSLWPAIEAMARAADNDGCLDDVAQDFGEIMDEAAPLLACITQEDKGNKVQCAARVLFGDAHDTMDGCLLENDCLIAEESSSSSSSGFAFSVGATAACAAKHCLHHVQSPVSLLGCTTGCAFGSSSSSSSSSTSSAVCAAQCLRKYSSMSPLTMAAVDCLPNDLSVLRIDDGASLNSEAIVEFVRCVAREQAAAGGGGVDAEDEDEDESGSVFWNAVDKAASCTLFNL